MFNYIEMPINNGIVLIDNDDDYDEAKRYNWENVGGYAICIDEELFGLPMHVFVLGEHTGLEIDHRNGNGLDNRKLNLRHCTHKQNLFNRVKRQEDATSKHKGVCYKPGRGKKWEARIQLSDKRKTIGYFDTEDKAAFAYNLYAKKYYGDFANLNKIEFKATQQMSGLSL